MYRCLVLLLVCLPLFAVSACRGPEEESPPISTSIVATPSVSADEERATPTPKVATVTVTPQLAKSPTVIPSATETGIPTSTATIEPTATPLPTLSPAEGEALLRSLMQADENCRLPCWWGIHPGVTEWQEIEPFLESFTPEIHRSANPQGSIVSYEIYFYFPDREFPSTSHWALYHMEEATVSAIELNVSHSLHWSTTYTLSQILADYGAPDEVWIGTYDNTPSGERPFRMALIYSKEGFVASYETGNVKKEGEAIVGCPLETPTRTFLWLTDGKSAVTFEEARSQTLQIGDDQLYLPLHEATDLTIEDFHTLFTETNDPNCLSTPAELWPY